MAKFVGAKYQLIFDNKGVLLEFGTFGKVNGTFGRVNGR